MYGLAVLSVAILAGQAAATALAEASPFTALVKRQLSGLDPSQIPSQCQTQCNGVVTTLQSCTDITCVCSNTVYQALYSCIECGLSIEPSELQSVQQSLTEYQSSCAQAGVTLTPLTLTAGSSSGKTAGNSATLGVTAAATAAGTTATAGTSSSNPLGLKSGAGMVGVSVASVVGAVGVAVVAFL